LRLPVSVENHYQLSLTRHRFLPQIVVPVRCRLPQDLPVLQGTTKSTRKKSRECFYTPGQACLTVTSHVWWYEMGSFCNYKQQKRISILCYGEFLLFINAEGYHLMILRHCQASLTGSIGLFIFFYSEIGRGSLRL